MATNSSVLLEFPFKVKKKSGKPFKSGKKVNKAIGIIKNENDHFIHQVRHVIIADIFINNLN